MGVRRLMVASSFITGLLRSGIGHILPRTPVPDDTEILEVVYDSRGGVVTLLMKSDKWPSDGPQTLAEAPLADVVWTKHFPEAEGR